MERAAETMGLEFEMAAVRPDYKPLARSMLDGIREFFSDPANEADYQQWLMDRKKTERREAECS